MSSKPELQISSLESSTIMLVGNPNCGKTSLFNALTGLRYKVANYPGVTVERKEGHIKNSGEKTITLIDIPGIYDFSGISEDEVIAHQSILGLHQDHPKPDLLIAVLDASNLERNLYLLTQLIELDISIVVALTMNDLAKVQGIQVHEELLSRELDLPVQSINTKNDLSELKRSIEKNISINKKSVKAFTWKKFLSKETPLSVSEEARARYSWIQHIIDKSVQKTFTPSKSNERIDSFLTHKIAGPFIFLFIMAAIFQSIFLWADIPMGIIENFIDYISEYMDSVLPQSMFKSLIIDGIITGVGNVIIFIPQIAILFFLLGILEDTGYLARAAFVMDRVMRPFGLQGRSFIPLLSSFACAIPGILSARTISSKSDRLVTILIAPLMSCSARLPVYTVLIAACIPDTYFFGFLSLQGFILLALYLSGIFGAAIIAYLIKATLLKKQYSLFLMEMPRIRMPALKTVLIDTYDRVKIFLKTAGTIILACSIVMWFLASFPAAPENIPHEESPVRYSFAGKLGQAIEPAIAPLGFNWEIGIAIIASFAAREVFVSTLATIYNLDTTEETSNLIETLSIKNASGEFSTATAASLMIFYVFACQCMSTLAVVKKETASWTWVVFMLLYMSIMAWILSYATFTIMSALGF